jgi:hypothetical protein
MAMRRLAGFLWLLPLVLGPSAAGAVTAAPGYAARTIPAPGTIQGGVVRSGAAIIVGQGSFGAGLQQIVRFEEGGAATTIATGFGSLGGFDLDAAGTLWVVDNCFDGDFGCDGATTGDTLYAIPDALTRTTALTADDIEVLPAGSIPSAFDVLVVPGAVLVSDAVGGGGGRVVEVVPGSPATASDLVTGLDLTAGLALQGTTLFVANAVVDPVTFESTGEVLRFALDGTPDGSLASDLAGANYAAFDGDGLLLLSGVGPFLASAVVAIAPGGGRARGRLRLLRRRLLRRRARRGPHARLRRLGDRRGLPRRGRGRRLRRRRQLPRGGEPRPGRHRRRWPR